jgi:6-pyruvoyl-tetrahydropterin synthase related domain
MPASREKKDLPTANGSEPAPTPKTAAGNARSSSLLWAPLLTISAAAFAAEIPFFFFGTPSGHDVEFHLYSWLEVLAQWKQGVFLPRWAAMAHFAYGEPRFVFYPPASWTLGALISAIVPWRLASPVYIWIALILAGASMFLLARRWMNRGDAIFAATLYAVNPYHLVIVYWRSAFAELLASCLVPLLVLLVVKVVDGERRVVVPLSLVLAAAWLTNAPAAVMIHYSLALLLLLFALQRRSWRVLGRGAAAVALGAALAAFYLLPAIYEQKWVNIAEAVSQGSRPIDNFLFIHTSDADHDAFNRIVSWIAALEIVVTLAAAWAARSWRKSAQGVWQTLLGWAVVCSMLMFPMTALLWKFLPKLEFMQFPWRWLLCLSVIFSIFVTLGLRRWWMRIALCAVSFLVIATAWQRIQPPWWDNASDLREMQDNMTDGIGYEGTDEYTPVGADPSSIDKAAWKVRVVGTAHSSIRVLQWNAETRLFTARMSAPDQLALRLFNYPAWNVEVDGHKVNAITRESTGQMLIPVEAGMNRVQITFGRTWDRKFGGWISGITVLLLLLWTVVRSPWLQTLRPRSSDLGLQPHRKNQS